MSKTALILQARSGSKRLPGKMSMLIGKWMLIEWLISRLSGICQENDLLLIVAIPYKDTLIKHLKHLETKYCFSVIEGEEDDVLARFIKVIDQLEVSSIIRVCGDNPFVSIEAINQLIVEFNSSGSYVYNHLPESNLCWISGLGAEMLTANELRLLDIRTTDILYREHVTLGLKKFGRSLKAPEWARNRNNIDLDINTMEDYVKISNLYKKYEDHHGSIENPAALDAKFLLKLI